MRAEIRVRDRARVIRVGVRVRVRVGAPPWRAGGRLQPEP